CSRDNPIFGLPVIRGYFDLW
nr:immunoglobulin heavy chain junction region [Macaca mulatta]